MCLVLLYNTNSNLSNNYLMKNKNKMCLERSNLSKTISGFDEFGELSRLEFLFKFLESSLFIIVKSLNEMYKIL